MMIPMTGHLRTIPDLITKIVGEGPGFAILGIGSQTCGIPIDPDQLDGYAGHR